MKLSIEKTELFKGLARIQSIVERRNSMPILANVLLDARSEGILEFAATDLEVGVRGTHSADVAEAGSITASAKKLFEIIRELPDESIHLEATPNAYLSIRCNRSEFTLAGTSPGEYPTLPSFDPERTVSVDAAVLVQMIDRTLYAASVDETRYNLNGVYLEVLEDSGKIRMVATDGHRLAFVDRAIGPDAAAALESGVIIPRKGLSELKRLCEEEGTEEVELAFSGNSGLAKKGDVTLVMRLIEGEFPSYSQVIPSESTIQLIIPSDNLIHALRRVVLFSSERSHAVQAEIKEGCLIVTSSSPELGDAREEIDLDYMGEPLKIGFNARYLLDALSSLRAKEVRMAFQNDLSPAQLVPTDDEDSLAVVMPMRV